MNRNLQCSVLTQVTVGLFWRILNWLVSLNRFSTGDIYNQCHLSNTTLLLLSKFEMTMYDVNFWFYTAQKMTFSIKDFFSKCDQIHRKLNLVTFAEEILNGKLHFLYSAIFGVNSIVTNFDFLSLFSDIFCVT